MRCDTSRFTLFVTLFLFIGTNTAVVAKGDTSEITNYECISSKHIGKLLKLFSDNINIQKKLTFFPLVYTEIDTDNNFITKSTTIKSWEKIHFKKYKSGGLFPTQMDRRLEHLRLIAKYRKSEMQVIITSSKDLGYQVIFHFRENHGCEKLFKIDSKSI